MVYFAVNGLVGEGAVRFTADAAASICNFFFDNDNCTWNAIKATFSILSNEIKILIMVLRTLIACFNLFTLFSKSCLNLS